MSATVLLMSVMVEHLWVTLPGSPYFASPGHVCLTLLILCVGAVLAFMMVWVEFTVIAQTSALTFMVAGTFKEVVTGGHFFATGAACSLLACAFVCVWCLPACSEITGYVKAVCVVLYHQTYDLIAVSLYAKGCSPPY